MAKESLNECMMRIPGYTIVRKIGYGGMAVVYLAVQDSLQREVALKVLRESGKDAPDIAVRFLNEAQTIARLEHANIVGIFDVGQTAEGELYYSMPNLTHGDLLGYTFDTDEKLSTVLQQICAGLAFAHQHGIIHRDIKPENILFDHQGIAQIADFGIAFSTRSTNTRLTKEGLTLGSSHHVSPEQAHGDPVDARSDIYSLGIVLFELLAGYPPFDGPDDVAILVSQVNDPVPRLPGEVRHWQKVVDRALEKSPDDRFQSAEEMAAAIAVVKKPAFATMDQMRATVGQLRAVEKRLRGLDRRGWIWGGTGLLAVVLIAALALNWSDSSQTQVDGPGNNSGQSVQIAPMTTEQIDQILRDGYQMIKDGQIIEPREANALDRFLEVLGVYPDSPEALAGLQSIINYYDQALVGAIERQDFIAVEDNLSALGAAARNANLEQDPRILDIRLGLVSAVTEQLDIALRRLDSATVESLLAIGMSIDPKNPSYADARQQLQAIGTGGELLDDPKGVPSVFVPAVITGQDGSQSRIDHGYAIAVHEVTVSFYQQFAQETGRSPGKCKKPGDPVALFRKRSWQSPGFAQSATDPIVCVSWHDASRFAQWLSDRSGHHYRLPSDEEWRHAAAVEYESGRACETGNVAGQDQGRVSEESVSCRDGFLQTAPVGSFEPNQLGIYDLEGNVSEWTVDCAPDKRTVDKVLGKLRLADRDRCDRRAARGTSWRDRHSLAMLSQVNYVNQDRGLTTLGIRVVRDLVAEKTDKIVAED